MDKKIYGVQYINGKIIANLYEKESDVSVKEKLVYEDELNDYIEELSKYNKNYRKKEV